MYGVFNERLADEQNPTQLGRYLHMPESTDMAMWIISVKHDYTVQINSRLTGTLDHGFESGQL